MCKDIVFFFHFPFIIFSTNPFGLMQVDIVGLVRFYLSVCVFILINFDHELLVAGLLAELPKFQCKGQLADISHHRDIDDEDDDDENQRHISTASSSAAEAAVQDIMSASRDSSMLDVDMDDT